MDDSFTSRDGTFSYSFRPANVSSVKPSKPHIGLVTSALESLIGCTIPFVATVDPPMHVTEKLYKAVASDFSGFTLATMERTLRNSLSRLHQQLCKHR